MRIALDYDGTYTRAREFWDGVIESAKGRGIEFVCITMRSPDEGIQMPCPIFYTSREGKLFWCARRGLKVDVWIDDQPEFIVMDARK